MSALANPDAGSAYLLAQDATERERLRIQAEVWAPATERLFDAAGVRPGARCLDLGCGAPGALGALARRVGASGQVIGVDNDARLVADAAHWIASEGLANVQVRCADAFATGLPSAAFDLIHVRFMFAPLGRASALLDEIERLLKPGGVIVIQEPDASAWQCWPPSQAFATLVGAIVDGFSAAGGDFNAGRKSLERLDARGYADVGVRSEVLTLRGGHPYARLPLLFAQSLSARLERALGNGALEQIKAECEAACGDPRAAITSFVVQQAWGTRP